MSALFLKIFDMSITASWLVLAVIILRPLFTKAPKWIRGILWSFVALRLVFPFSIESIFSMMPRFNSSSVTLYETKTEAVVLDVPAFNQAVESLVTNPSDSVDPMQILIFVLSIVWVIGIILMLSYMTVTY
ncbi:MAG: transcriptional regulator, partial [Clostridia bacterium]|nr:transcriptional regulator [Clostridia bacterium]